MTNTPIVIEIKELNKILLSKDIDFFSGAKTIKNKDMIQLATISL